MCAACATGTHSTHENSPRCVPDGECAAGTYAVDAVCEECPAGTWNDGTSPASCQTPSTCAAGFWVAEEFESTHDRRRYVATDATGDVYVAANTLGDVDRQGSRGERDVFVRKLSGAPGTEIWRAQLGSTGTDLARGIALAPDGRLVIASVTSGDLTGTGGQDAQDVFVHKLSATDGEPHWTVQLELDASAVAVHANGDIAVSGSLDDHAIVRRLGPAGETLWEKTLEESSGGGEGVAFDSAGNVAVSYWKSVLDAETGYQRTDAYVRLLSSDDGTELWTSSPASCTRTSLEKSAVIMRDASP